MVRGRNDARWVKLSRYLRQVLPPVCWLCGEEIDTTLPRRDKRSWTLDHIKPLSEFPELAYEESNLRPAHMQCNSKRGIGKTQPVNVSHDWG